MAATSQRMSYASAAKSQRHPRGQQTQPRRSRPANANASTSPAARPDNSSPTREERHKVNREKVTGARRVWGTFADATTKSVKAAMRKVFAIGESDEKDLNVIRRYKPGGRGRKARWWFILKSNESTLAEIEGKWESMEMQTGWKIEPCYRPVDSILESNQVATSETQNHTASAQVNQNEAIPNDRPQSCNENHDSSQDTSHAQTTESSQSSSAASQAAQESSD